MTERGTLTRKWQDPATQSVFGELAMFEQSWLTVEREWRDNLSGRSCVPAGFYVLEPHDGTIYKNTFALVGESVSHADERSEGVLRFACVMHRAIRGSQLKGCVSAGSGVSVDLQGLYLDGLDRGDKLLSLLREAGGGLLTIQWDHPGMETT